MAKKKFKAVNREISWLSFNGRVLQEAGDPNVPLVERIRFLGIFSNNRDEFFRVRVATVRRMMNLGRQAKEILHEKPKKLIAQIQEIVIKQEKRFEDIYKDILAELRKEQIFLINEGQLNKEQAEFVKNHFQKNVRHVLVPIMMSAIGKVPYLKDKSIYLAIKLIKNGEPQQVDYALIEVPTDFVSRFLVLPQIGDKKYIILLDDVIRHCLPDVFSIFQYDSIEAYTVKMTRDAELDIDNDLSKSFVEKLSESVQMREQGEPVRFVYDSEMPEDLLHFFDTRLRLHQYEKLISGGRYHNFKDFMGFPNVGGRHLEKETAIPLPHRDLVGRPSILEVMQEKDVLLHFPYHTFDYTVDLLREAAIDPQVASIKMTLYRAAQKSNVINALISAAENGKQVTAVLEPRARFDEEANIYWANELQKAGAQVIFGVPGLKVHSKLCLITRRDGRKKVRFAYISTGNFNEKTALIYSDTSLLTADRNITLEVNKVFDFFENNYNLPTYNRLIIAPHHTRKKINRLVNNEIKNAKAGKDAWIFLKMNSLVDNDMVRRLYLASQAGVKIRLIVRGICSIIPGVEGLSENIEAISIVDKYLEHSRVYVFCNGGEEQYFISSADFMKRNLDYRVEVTCPIFDKNIQQELRDWLEIQWSDNAKARLHNGKQNNPYKTGDNEKSTRSQDAFYKYLKDKNKK